MSIKTLTFFSNYFNHHQKALCDAWYALLKDGFTFVETMPMEGFREKMGWGEEDPPYLLRTYESEANHRAALKLALDADLVVMGTAPESFIEERLKKNRIIFRYSERPLKEGFIKFFIPRLTVKYLHLHVRNRKKPVYILAASAFTALDYHRMFCSYENKCYRFGYFPEHIPYDVQSLMEEKQRLSGGVPTILWMGRMIRLKHPELVVKALGHLKASGYAFRLKMVGNGPEREKTERLVERCGLKDVTQILDFLKPHEAREEMEKAMIYVMTSNKLEGWGSVIYEAQNAGCAQVASHACGATPWLVKHGETGLVFRSKDVGDLTRQLKSLLDDPEKIRTYGTNAYALMHSLWNPEVAASRVIELGESVESVLASKTEAENAASGYVAGEAPFADGPCAKAGFLRNDWIRERV